MDTKARVLLPAHLSDITCGSAQLETLWLTALMDSLRRRLLSGRPAWLLDCSEFGIDASARNIIERNRGSLTVSSQEGVGSTITMRVPLATS